MIDEFILASCQMDVVDDKQRNIEHATELVKKASSNGATVVTLPEMFNTPYDNMKFVENCETEDNSTTLDAMKTLAKSEEIYLQCGSIAEKCEDKLYNTAYLINPEGEIILKHRKMHMFDIDTKNVTFKESDTLSPGDAVSCVDTPIAKFGLAICYDIRFPELWTLMCDEGCDIILLPGAFNKTTGPAHWSTLIRARAIDNEFYVAATSPSQVENPYYTAWGQSMVVSPWGEVLNSCIEEEEIIYTNITRSLLDKMRNEIPCLKNKRKDVYETIRK